MQVVLMNAHSVNWAEALFGAVDNGPSDYALSATTGCRSEPMSLSTLGWTAPTICKSESMIAIDLAKS
jgi:hypothetical protein